jgi:hypothetical protein
VSTFGIGYCDNTSSDLRVGEPPMPYGAKLNCAGAGGIANEGQCQNSRSRCIYFWNRSRLPPQKARP